MVEFLAQVPGVNLVRAVRNAPFLLVILPGEIPHLEGNALWLKRALNLQGHDIGKVISGNAYVLTRPVKDLQAVVDFIIGLGFSIPEARSMILRFPRVMAMRDNRLDYTVHSLHARGLDEEQVKKVLWKQPATCE